MLLTWQEKRIPNPLRISYIPSGKTTYRFQSSNELQHYIKSSHRHDWTSHAHFDTSHFNTHKNEHRPSKTPMQNMLIMTSVSETSSLPHFRHSTKRNWDITDKKKKKNAIERKRESTFKAIWYWDSWHVFCIPSGRELLLRLYMQVDGVPWG